MKRTCGCCHRRIDIEEFHRSKSHPGGRDTTCALCMYAHSRKSILARNKRFLGLPSIFNSIKYVTKATICAKWLENSESFFFWALEHGFKKGWKVARKGNIGIYSPGNCICMSGLDFRRRPCGNPGVKLNEDKVRRIRLRLRNFDSGVCVAYDFGVSPQTISSIHTRNTWSDVV